ncbi:GMC family oxidoreductase [Zhongshania sp. BJYM1]|uniref:GMC family oxidoreductase n=1 Tax=Zhongshania aquatica TaxID=2965069 RepID=UPI0022B40916|nr:GMC oxidoreductase [Marortus sp. BJYM1]
MAFVKTRPDLKQPDIQLHFLPFGYIIQPHSRSAITAYQPKQNAMMITITLCKPKTRGTVSLDTQGNALIQHQLFSAPEDMETLVKGAKLAEHIYQQPALAKHTIQPCSPETLITDDEAWRQYIRARANISYHFCGSCSMGNDPSSVVDEQLRVHGLQGLRVVDASIMPIITSGNTNATVIAIAERAADFILG